MYDFYPEWGPARHRGDDERPAVRRPRYWQATGTRTARTPVLAGAPEQRDADAELPDDN